MSNTIICGQMKEGKTTLAQYLAFEHSPGSIAWDPRGMIDGVKCYSPQELHSAIYEKRWREGILTYIPQHDVEIEFSAFCRVVFPPRFTLRSFSCIIDEAAQLQRSNSIHPALDRAVRQHPRDVLLIQTTHSMQDYFRSSKDLMNDLYCFKLKGNSLKAVVDYCDGQDDMREAIANLPPHHLMHYNFERHCGPEFEIWNEPNSWYIPLDPHANSLQSSAGKSSGEESAAVTSVGGGAEGRRRPTAENNYEGWVH